MVDDPGGGGLPLFQQPVQESGVEATQAFLPHDLLQDDPGVPKPREGLGVQHACLRQLAQPLFQRDQGTQQVAAVDAGDVARLQGGQGADIVPVQQVAAVKFQPADALQRAGEPFKELVQGQVAAVVGPQGAGQPETDVGRAGAHGEAVLMGHLVVVRGEPRGIGADEGREVAPGAAAHSPQEAQVRLRQRPLGRLP